MFNKYGLARSIRPFLCKSPLFVAMTAATVATIGPAQLSHGSLINNILNRIDQSWPGACARIFSNPSDRLLYLSTSIRRIQEIIDDDLNTERMFESLFSVYGAVHQPENPIYRMRPYQSASPAKALASDVVGIEADALSEMMVLSAEIEAPILGYQGESGNAFSILLRDSLARFMGRTLEAQRQAESEGRGNRCDSTWCHEENRHATVLKKLAEAIRGAALEVFQPTGIGKTRGDLEFGLYHLANRQGSETGASSAYTMMGSHILEKKPGSDVENQGVLARTLQNVRRDEFKHLISVSSAWIFLMGREPNYRLFRLLDKNVREFFESRDSRTGGSTIFNNPYNIVEVVAAHALVEARARAFLSQLPLMTLEKVFDDGLESRPMTIEQARFLKDGEILEALEDARLARRQIQEITLSRDHWLGRGWIEERV